MTVHLKAPLCTGLNHQTFESPAAILQRKGMGSTFHAYSLSIEELGEKFNTDLMHVY